jgi:hypothetical protein
MSAARFRLTAQEGCPVPLAAPVPVTAHVGCPTLIIAPDVTEEVVAHFTFPLPPSSTSRPKLSAPPAPGAYPQRHEISPVVIFLREHLTGGSLLRLFPHPCRACSELHVAKKLPPPDHFSGPLDHSFGLSPVSPPCWRVRATAEAHPSR